jgi:hypothetical protein
MRRHTSSSSSLVGGEGTTDKKIDVVIRVRPRSRKEMEAGDEESAALLGSLPETFDQVRWRGRRGHMGAGAGSV